MKYPWQSSHAGCKKSWWNIYGWLISGLCVWLSLRVLYYAMFIWLTPMREEVSLLHYMAWLIDERSFTPYKDVLDPAFPGSILFHMAIGRSLGYSDIAFHFADSFWLSLMCVATGFLVRPFGLRIVAVCVTAWMAVYFSYGPAMSLQRDYVGILPVVLALVLAINIKNRCAWKLFLIGALFGLATSIKPHLIIGAPVVACAYFAQRSGDKYLNAKSVLVDTFWAISGLLFIFAALVFWLYSQNGLVAFIDMLSQNMLVYMRDDGIRSDLWAMLAQTSLSDWVNQNIPTDLGGRNITASPLFWQFSNISAHLLMAFLDWGIPACLGLGWAFSQIDKKAEQRVYIKILLAMMVVYWLYPVLANKYWNYHWMPFRYFALLCFCLLLVPSTKSGMRGIVSSSTALILFIWIMYGKMWPPNGSSVQENFAEWQKNKFSQNRDSSDDIAQFLQMHLNAGDVVQPIDEGGPVMRGMLLAKATLATPYMTYRQLLVNESHPVVQQARQQFLDKIHQNPPRFFINTYTAPQASFFGERYRFEALDTLLQQDYHPVLNNCGSTRCFLTIWEKNKP